MKRDELTASLRPLVQRMHRTYCWKKTPDGPRRIDVPFTAVMLSEHVMGVNAYGLCPISPGTSTCQVACLDLDSHKGETPWPDMVKHADSLCTVLDMVYGLKPHAFRSSGGSGVHIYLTWEKPQDAYSVRETLREVLANCNLKPGTKGIAAGEVEIFPKQNEVKGDGYGSMFILPWAGKSEPLGSFTAWHDSADVLVRTREERSAARAQTQALPAVARLRSALDAIPNTGDGELSYDEWRNIVFAVHAATEGSDIGLDLIHEWSARASKYDSDFINNRVWPYIRSDRDGPSITEGTLFAAASNLGWQDTGTLDDFDVVANDAPSSAAEGSAEPKLRFRSEPEHEFTERPAPEYIVPDVIPDADLVVVYGESGSGKTFWTLDVAQAIAQGVPWCTRTVKQGRVFYIAAEGSGGFRNRLKSYKAERGVERTDLFVLADQPSFLEAAHVKDLIKEIRRVGPVKVVIVDTLAQVSPGGAENSSEDMGKVIMHCRMIRKHTGALVILIHHSGKDAARGARGWSGLRGAVDAEIEIVRVEHDRVATVTKQKDGEDGMEFGFKLRQVEIGKNASGGTVTSCVVDHGAVAKAVKTKAVKLGAVEEIVLKVLRERDDVGAGGDKRMLYDDLKTAARDQLPGSQSGVRAGRAVETLIGKGLIESDGKHIWLAGQMADDLQK